MAELDERMGLDEYDMWWDEYRGHPWGEKFLIPYFAQIAYYIVNYAGKYRKDSASLSEFIIDFGPAEEAKEPDPATFFSNLNK